MAAKLNQKGLLGIHLSLGTAAAAAAFPLSKKKKAAAAETKWIPANKLETIRFRGATMCCIPVLCGAIQSQLHIAYQCSAESPLLTMVARTTSGGHYQAHVAVLECVFLYNHCMFFI